MKNIKIKKQDIAREIAKGLKNHVDLSGWNIYADENGRVDLRNNTEPTTGWIFITTMYGLDEQAAGDEEVDFLDFAEWVVSEMVPVWHYDGTDETIKITLV